MLRRVTENQQAWGSSGPAKKPLHDKGQGMGFPPLHGKLLNQVTSCPLLAIERAHRRFKPDDLCLVPQNPTSVVVVLWF